MVFIKNKCISLIFLFSALFGLSQAYEGKECDGKQLVNCYIDYLSTFLLPTLPSPPSYHIFSRLYLDAQCKGGWKEQEILCGYQDALTHCMKGNEACLKTSAYEQYLNLGEEDARNYQTDFKVRQYQCGPGKNIVNVYDYELQRCDDIQSSIVTKEPPSMNCSRANEYVACMSSVYGRRCGTAVKPFICNIAELTVRSNTESNFCDQTMPKCASIIYP